jgi:hypothetical protein
MVTISLRITVKDGALMFDDLLRRVGSDRPAVTADVGSVPDLFESVGGLTVGGGLLRVHTHQSAMEANELVTAAYPEYAGRVCCFAFDWAGRQFSLDLTEPTDMVHLFDIGAGEVLEIPVSLEDFFNEEAVQYSDAALAESFFDTWIRDGGAAPDFDQCVGYRRALFLGGVDDVTNLELLDISVYWTITGQLWVGTRDLPRGTKIDSIRIE